LFVRFYAFSVRFCAFSVLAGDWYSQHPSDKQTPAKYLADQALKYVYGKTEEDVQSNTVDFPLCVRNCVYLYR
jgi:hypothetical protein